MSTYTVVLRCSSSARFRPEEGQVVTLTGMPGIEGSLQIRLRTRWLDQGHEAPIPRELWIEVRLEATDLDLAISRSAAVARMLASVIAFTANVQCGAPEVHLAFDSTAGHTDREFVEIFLGDEQGLPREGRLIEPAEFTAVFEALDRAQEAKRLSRALSQYELALRYWYFGGEYLALSHLYMAVETLTKAVLRAECDAAGIDDAELARRNAIDPDDPDRPRWRPALDTWTRQELIFQSDKETYEAAKGASDGVEHGFMELDEVHRRAVSATESTFGYVRTAMLRLLGLDEQVHPSLHGRPPRDVRSLRKMVRGRFIGDLDDVAQPGEEYPYLEWHSNVRTMTRTGDEFKMTFNERFTVRCHPDVSFEGVAFEARGRLESGHPPMKVELGEVIEQSADPTRESVLAALGRAASFAVPLGTAAGRQGLSPVQALSMFRFSMQLALFESVQTLLTVDRAPEALVLTHGLIRNTAILQLSSSNEHGSAVAIQARLNALDRQANLYGDSSVEDHLSRQREALENLAESLGVSLPYDIPELDTTPFLLRHAKDAQFIEEMTLSDVAAMDLHLEVEADGPSFRTQSTDSRLRSSVASLAIDGLVSSASALATICNLEYDQELLEDLEALVFALDPDLDTRERGAP